MPWHSVQYTDYNVYNYFDKLNIWMGIIQKGLSQTILVFQIPRFKLCSSFYIGRANLSVERAR